MKKKYVVIFRSENLNNNLFLENEISKNNNKVKTFPILKLTVLRKRRILTEGVQAICITSINGISILSKLINNKKIKLFTIGTSSKKFAKSCGFKNVIDCNGDSDSMLNIILKNTVKGNGDIIYAGAKNISINMPGMLKQKGYYVRRYILYKTTFVDLFCKEFINIVNRNELDWIVLLSRKGAQNCSRLIKKNFSEKQIDCLKFACLSQNIAEVLPSRIKNKFYPNKVSIKELINIITRKDQDGC